MNEDHLRSILDRLPMVDRVGRSGDGFLSTPCLLAETRHLSGKDSRPSMTISISDSLSFVRCWSCGYKRPFVDMLFELNMIYGGLADLAIEAQQVEQNRPFKLVANTKNEEINSYQNYTEVLNELYQNPWSEKAVELLNQKGVTLDIARKYGCCFAPKGTDIALPDGTEMIVQDDLIVFPIMTSSPDNSLICVGAQGRYVERSKTRSKYFAPLPFKSSKFFFGEQALSIRRSQPIILTEGPLDAMHVVQEGYRALALMGLSLQDKKASKLLLANPKYVILLLDPDGPGQQAVGVIKNTLLKHNIQTIVRRPDKDPKYLTKQDLSSLLLENTNGTIRQVR